MILVSCIRPFDAKQKIYVFSNDKENVEEIRLCSLENYAKAVMQLSKEYGINSVDLYGLETICNKVKQDILEEEMCQYNNNQLIINYKGVSE